MFRWAGLTIDMGDLFRVTIPGWVILTLGGMTLAYLGWRLKRPRLRLTSAVRYSDVSLVRAAARTFRQRLRGQLPYLRLIALGLLFVALARPQAGVETQEVNAEGIDIMLVLDISGSMKAEDFKPDNRLAVAKDEIKRFVGKRVNDRIGLVVFARTAFTQCPLTLDYGVLVSFLEQVNFGLIEDGTAIGTGLVTAANRLRETEGKSKVIVLLTDGVSNAGEIDPLTAADVCKTLNLRVYTIGAGRPGNAMYPVDDPIFGKRYVYLPNEIDEEALREIAKRTGGKYFRARSEKELEHVYDEIDRLEKTEIKVNAYVNYREWFPYFTLLGFLFLVGEFTLAQTVLRKIP